MSAEAPRLAEYQMTPEEAREFGESGRWRDLSLKERAILQLGQDCLCMDFSAFHEAVTELLGRPVYTHEFAKPDLLWAEYQTGEPIDFEAILEKLPEHLRRSAILIQPGDA
jgi:hypothetical protein